MYCFFVYGPLDFVGKRSPMQERSAEFHNSLLRLLVRALRLATFAVMVRYEKACGIMA